MRNEQNSASFGDYLHALAFRVLHEDRVLQPRRASLFETERAGLEEDREPARIEVAELLRPSGVVPVPLESGNTPLALPATAGAPRAGLVAEAEPPKLQRGPRPDSRIAPEVEPVVSRGEGTGNTPGDPVSSTPLRTSVEVIRTAIARERLRVVPEPSPTPDVPKRVAESPAAKRPSTPPAPQDAKRAQRQSPETVEVAVRVASPPAEITQTIRTEEKAAPMPAPMPPRRREPPQAQAVLMARAAPETRLLTPLFTHPPRANQEETTVEISIGRLEIRGAQTTPSAPPRTPPRQPEVSLKEYLNRNAGGRS